jgi:hypothetical protein
MIFGLTWAIVLSIVTMPMLALTFRVFNSEEL